MGFFFLHIHSKVILDFERGIFAGAVVEKIKPKNSLRGKMLMTQVLHHQQNAPEYKSVVAMAANWYKESDKPV